MRSIVVAGLSALACAASGAVRLVPGTTEVVIRERPSATVEFAAIEMTNVLSRVFGSPVPIVNRPSPGKAAIILGDNEWSRAAGIDVAALPPEGFVIRTVGKDRVLIAGVDADLRTFIHRGKYTGSMKVKRATSFGVYEFLERFADVRFYFPGELGTVVPHADELTVPDTDFTDAPDFPIRSYYHAANDSVWFEPTGGRLGKRLNQMRTRMESAEVPCCHGSLRFEYVRRFAATHPEYFLVDGKGRRHDGTFDGTPLSREPHICWTSGITNEVFLDAKAYLTGAPAASRGLRRWGRNCSDGTYVDIMPNDGYPGCRCANCSAVRAPAGRRETEIIWRATAGIAQRLIDEGVPGYITQMAYHPYAAIPDFTLPTNVLVMVAKAGPFSKYDTAGRAAEKRSIAAWAEKVGHKVWLWNYPDKWGTRVFNGVPQMCPHAWGEYYQEMAPYIIGSFAEAESDRWFYNHLNFYVYGKVSWRIRTDIGKLLDEYYARMYGSAADDVKRLFEEMEETWLRKVTARTIETPMGPQCRVPSTHDLWHTVYTKDLIVRWDGYLRAAVAKVPQGSLERRRLLLVRDEMLKPLATERQNYIESQSVEAELKRRAAHPDEKSIVKNGDFTAPRKGRFFGGWGADSETEVVLDHDVSVTGGVSCRLTGGEKGRVVTQFLPDLKPETKYMLSFFLKLDNVRSTSRGGGVGMTVHDAVQHTYPPRTLYSGTMDWTHCRFVFKTLPHTNERTKSYIRAKFSRGTSGTAWFDGIRLVEIEE